MKHLFENGSEGKMKAQQKGYRGDTKKGRNVIWICRTSAVLDMRKCQVKTGCMKDVQDLTFQQSLLSNASRIESLVLFAIHTNVYIYQIIKFVKFRFSRIKYSTLRVPYYPTVPYICIMLIALQIFQISLNTLSRSSTDIQA